MKVLDIDLDAFVVGTATIGESQGQRLPESEYSAWTEGQVRAFLEYGCRLSCEKRTPGAVFEHHHEAFFYWQRRIESGQLSIPFDVVHVDAHSDVSSEGTGAHIYVLTELLAIPLAERATALDPTRVTFANFPVFAAALGWLRSFVWVRPLTGDDGILEYYVGDGSIHLKRFPIGIFERGSHHPWRETEPLGADAPIPAETISMETYQANQPFDLVSLCRSPQFTPASADAVFDVVREYIDEGER